MGKIIQVDKNTSRLQLDEKLARLKTGKKTIDLNKYLGKINFKTDGLSYQLRMRDEWQ